MDQTQSQTKEKTQEKSVDVDAQFFTMPEAYRHGKEAKLVEPKTVTAPHIASIPPTPPPPTPLATHPLLKQNTVSPTTKALSIAGIAVFLSLSIGGFLIWKSQTPTSKTPSAIISQPSTSPIPTPVPVPIVTPEPDVIPLPTESPFVAPLTPGKDSDSDGLTDIEEQLIYGTNVSLPDTDFDGFLDGNEVFHLYNPGGIAPGTLLEATLVKSHIFDYVSLFYPALWKPEFVTDTVSSISFRAPTGESILVSLHNTTTVESQQELLASWIEKQGGEQKVVKTKTKGTHELYVSRDQMNAFVTIDNHVVWFQYQNAAAGTIEYTQTFQMMLNSLSLVVPSVP